MVSGRRAAGTLATDLSSRPGRSYRRQIGQQSTVFVDRKKSRYAQGPVRASHKGVEKNRPPPWPSESVASCPTLATLSGAKADSSRGRIWPKIQRLSDCAIACPNGLTDIHARRSTAIWRSNTPDQPIRGLLFRHCSRRDLTKKSAFFHPFFKWLDFLLFLFFVFLGSFFLFFSCLSEHRTSQAHQDATLVAGDVWAPTSRCLRSLLARPVWRTWLRSTTHATVKMVGSLLPAGTRCIRSHVFDDA